jgi:hypothetical protein
VSATYTPSGSYPVAGLAKNPDQALPNPLNFSNLVTEHRIVVRNFGNQTVKMTATLVDSTNFKVEGGREVSFEVSGRNGDKPGEFEFAITTTVPRFGSATTDFVFTSESVICSAFPAGSGGSKNEWGRIKLVASGGIIGTTVGTTFGTDVGTTLVTADDNE